MDLKKPRRDQILRDATALFCRYGYAKTTLADVARRSEISRPTLYAEFADKDVLFGAVIETLADDLFARLSAERAHIPSERDRLLHACLGWVASGYDLVQENPEAADLFDPRFAAVRASNTRFEHYLEELLTGSDSPTPLTEMITLSLQGIKRFAENRSHLEALVATLVDTVIAARAV
ncbi:TetR/AcrR family transcriptional regulator [Mycetocola tolaasinivorans]|uniref:TetR/AcrR family transcriptional regulator n=1 Tax=Mycetocola tolaasinivorans TaxID=76635 RepID=A0A3L7ADQ5_9MICO|nr:TetR/AcrR family transcriptional regulator [Mycetocola tolaasinivorans]RLP77940.1 TetR/AcrR family transcriptional regulator [Mycetocola tolaasinivorans]